MKIPFRRRVLRSLRCFLRPCPEITFLSDGSKKVCAFGREKLDFYIDGTDSYRCNQIWNNIPTEVRNANNLETFKRLIKRIKIPCSCKLCTQWNQTCWDTSHWINTVLLLILVYEHVLQIRSWTCDRKNEVNTWRSSMLRRREEATLGVPGVQHPPPCPNVSQQMK